MKIHKTEIKTQKGRKRESFIVKQTGREKEKSFPFGKWRRGDLFINIHVELANL